MEIIYVDSLFFINLIINYFILLATGKVCAVRLRRWRYCLAAGLGAAYAVMVVIPGFAFLATAVMKLVLAGVMVLASFGGEKNLIRCAVVFLAVSAAFGGAVWAASMLSGMPMGTSLYVPISMRVLVVSFAICYAAISIVFKRSTKRAEREILSLVLRFQDTDFTINALRDTGNDLYDPLSGSPVLVAEKNAIMPLFRPEITKCLEMEDPMEAITELSQIPGCAGKFRLIPYRAVGTDASLLLAFRPDYLSVNGKQVSSALVAITPTRLCEDGEYAAIF